MSTFQSGIYGTDGRMKGSFVYMLLCNDAEGPIYIKAGLSDTPTKRLNALRVACPITPRYFYVVEVHSRDQAKIIEAELLSAFEPWHHNGEWFKIPVEDKAEFNESWKKVFRFFSTPAWPLSWTKIAVQPLAEAAKKRKQFVQTMYVKRGRAFQDFKKDLRMSQE